MGIKINPNIDFGSFLRSVTSKDKIDQQIQKVTDYLEKKYDEKFEVLRVGDREDKYNDDIKIICHPISNPNIIFYARGNSLEEYEDDYCVRSVLCQVEQAIIDEFKNKEYEATAKVTNVVKDVIDKKVDVDEFIKINPSQLLLAYIVVNGQIESKVVNEVINNVRAKYQGLKLKAFVYRMNSINYENYCKFVNTNDSTSRTIIQKYLPSKLEVIEE